MRLQLTDGTLVMYRAIESLAPVQNPGGWSVEVRTVSGVTYTVRGGDSREAAERVMNRIVHLMAACESV